LIELTEDIWTHAREDTFIVVPTNGFVKSNGDAVMGRGLAYQASKKFPTLQHELGSMLKEHGNYVYTFPTYGIVTFPVKDVWWNKATLELIDKSCQELSHIIEFSSKRFFIPRVGCGNGQLSWNDVKPILWKWFETYSDKVILCDNRSGD
jgi:hypothetical protein